MQVKRSNNLINKNLLILHLTVVVWGFTGLLGKLISISAVSLVWYRVFIAFVSLFVYFKLFKVPIKVNKSTFIILLLTGGLLATHWILFFASIKFSTIPVTLVCLSSITLFTAIFEPIINKKRISKLQLFAGVLIITGIVIIFKFETKYTFGITIGLISAMVASIFPIINSKMIKNNGAMLIGFYELLGAFIWISIYLFFSQGFTTTIIPTYIDIFYLLVLGTICTSVAYVAGVSVMRELPVFRVALITNLEPVYGILIAFIFYRDLNNMTVGFWIGAGIILSTIILYPITQRKVYERKNKGNL
jgi:drug/metabolite transporter (DMT)-like permease